MMRRFVWGWVVAFLLCQVTGVAWAQDFEFDDGGGEEGGGDGGDGGDGGGDGGDFEFDFDGGGGDDGGGDTTPSMDASGLTIDETSPAFLTMQEASGYIESQQNYQASLMLHKVLTDESETGQALKPKAHYEMCRTLYHMGLYQSGLYHCTQVLYYGTTTEYYMPTLQWLILISRELPGDPKLLSRFLDHYIDVFPTGVDEQFLAEMSLLMGQAAYQREQLDDAIFFLSYVDRSNELFPKAKFIEGITYVRKLEAQPAVDAFKDILRYVDEQAAAGNLTRELLEFRELTIISLGRVFYSVGSGLWNAGERAKAVKSWGTAIKYYGTFTQKSPRWLDSLFEASWTYFRVDDFNRALGLLHTLNSPFFNDEYYPEAMVLQAIIYYTNCHYDRVMYILEEYKAVYPPMKDRLDQYLTQFITPEDVYGFLRDIYEGNVAFDATVQQVLNAALKDATLRRTMRYIDNLDAEVERIKTADAGWSKSPLAAGLIQEIQFTKDAAAIDAGRIAKSRLERVLKELTSLNNQIIDIEIETVEKQADAAEQKGLDPAAVQEYERSINEMLSADDEHLFWTFDGEYWRDELGYYYYYITSRCGR